jgi:hypothetical protein
VELDDGELDRELDDELNCEFDGVGTSSSMA